jgi:polyphenol oxidase
MQADTLTMLAVDWPVLAGVGAGMSTRAGGASAGPYASLNLGDHVGDEAAAVAENRARFAQALGAEPVWLRQVHGARVVDAGTVPAGELPEADGAWTDQPGVACAVLVADCLPVLLAARNGRAVGAAHAGWRGLAAGVVERTLEAVAHAAACEAHEVVAWLGPCIGPQRFEVGSDVLAAFAGSPAECFVASPAREGRARWMADLPGLARDRLHAAGVRHIAGGHWCTVDGSSDFFSFRRDGVTGRLAAAVWLHR